MAVFSRRTVTLLLLALLMLSLALRYPLVDHERYQGDSYFLHHLSQSIVTEGYAKWVFHPFSYFGYYPISYPSGFPFVIAEFSTLTGLSVEVSILLIGILMGALFCLAVFCLAREFLHRTEFALLAAFFATVGPRFVDISYWVGSARTPFAVFAALTVFLFLYAASKKQRSLMILGLVFCVACLVIHHMAVLLVLFGLAFVLAAPAYRLILPSSRPRRNRIAAAYLGSMSTWLIVGASLLSGYFIQSIVVNFTRTPIFNFEPEAGSILLNMAASYTSQVGVVLPAAFIGAIHMVTKSTIARRDLLLLAVPISFLPLLGSSLYVSLVILPFVSVLGAKWVSSLSRSGTRRRWVALVVVVLVTSSLAVSVWSVQRWNSVEYISGDTVCVENQVFNDAAYLGRAFDRGESLAVSNSQFLSSQLAATSGVEFLRSGLYSALTGDVTSEDVKGNITWAGFGFPFNLYLWFEYDEEWDINYYVLGLMMKGVVFVKGDATPYSGAPQYFSMHPKILVVADNNLGEKYATVYGIYRASLLAELTHAQQLQSVANQADDDPGLDSYVIYQSSRSTLYIVDLMS